MLKHNPAYPSHQRPNALANARLAVHGDTPRLLLISHHGNRGQLLGEALISANFARFTLGSPQSSLAEQIAIHRPELVIIDHEQPERIIGEIRQLLQQHLVPMLLFTSDDRGELITRAIDAGVCAYVVDGWQSQRLRPIIEAALARHRQLIGLREEIERTRSSLAERKAIERAKGILMSTRKLSEEEAYHHLRKQAMKTNRKLVDIATSIIQAAELLLDQPNSLGIGQP